MPYDSTPGCVLFLMFNLNEQCAQYKIKQEQSNNNAIEGWMIYFHHNIFYITKYEDINHRDGSYTQQQGFYGYRTQHPWSSKESILQLSRSAEVMQSTL